MWSRDPSPPARPSGAACRFGHRRGQEILDATLEVLLESGYDRLTFDAVAARARASKATLYRYWPTKVELVRDAVAEIAPARIDLPDTGSLEGDLEALIAAAATTEPVRSTLDVITAVGTAAKRDEQVAEVARTCLLQPLLEQLEVVFGRARDRGTLPADADVAFLSSVIPAMVMFHTCLAGEESSPVAVLRRVAREIVLPLAGEASGDASTDVTAAPGRRRPAS